MTVTLVLLYVDFSVHQAIREWLNPSDLQGFFQGGAVGGHLPPPLRFGLPPLEMT